jgi:phospholipase/carboxylesterase
MQDRLSLAHKIRKPRAPAAGSPPLLLMLHGLGGNEEDLLGFADELDPRYFVVSARAPHPMGGNAYAWFRVDFTRGGPVIDRSQAEAGRLAVLGFIDELVAAYGVDAGRVHLLGFSQGAMMGFSAVLTEPGKVAALAAMSGRILDDIPGRIASPELLEGLPVFISHGTEDEIVPIREGRSAKELLTRLRADLDYHEYPMGHGIGAESRVDLAAWLGRRLGV